MANRSQRNQDREINGILEAVLGNHRGILIAGMTLAIFGRDKMKSWREGADVARGNPFVERV